MGNSIFMGENWNTSDELPLVMDDWRVCPECGVRVKMHIVAYTDAEYWTCPRAACKAHITRKPENGRYGTKTEIQDTEIPDRTKERDDFKRNADRRYLTGKRRKEYLDDE